MSLRRHAMSIARQGPVLGTADPKKPRLHVFPWTDADAAGSEGRRHRNLTEHGTDLSARLKSNKYVPRSRQNVV